MKFRYLLVAFLAFFHASVLAAGENITAQIQFPGNVKVNYADLKVGLYARNGRKLGGSVKVSSDLTITFPVTYPVGMLQVRQRSPKKGSSSTMLLVAGVYFKQKKVEINGLTTVRALFTKQIEDVYSTIRDDDKPRAEKIIVTMLEEERSSLEQAMGTDGYSVKKFAGRLITKQSFKDKAEQINAALASAIKSGDLKVRAMSPIADVRKSLEALISCQSNPMTYGTNPAEEQSLRSLLHDEFKRSGDGAVLKRAIDLFGAKVTEIFPGSLGTSPAFAAILATDRQTLRSKVQAAGIDLSQCTQETCEIKINEKATLLMADAAVFTGERNKNGPAMLLGCIYPYVR